MAVRKMTGFYGRLKETCSIPALYYVVQAIAFHLAPGALSGHKEGSKAFARYRVTDEVAEANAKEIDKDMKRDLVSMLE